MRSWRGKKFKTHLLNHRPHQVVPTAEFKYSVLDNLTSQKFLYREGNHKFYFHMNWLIHACIFNKFSDTLFHSQNNISD